MSRRRRGGLTPEDRALWRAAMRDATPLPPDLRRGSAGPSAAPGRKPDAPSAPQPEPQPPSGRILRPSPAPEPPLSVISSAPLVHDRSLGPGLDRRTFQRMRRGQLEPEARIDLHGMSASRAHVALEAFIASALARGLRLVLVITGKGGARAGDGPDAPFMLPPPGVLRRHSPRWLRYGPHGHEIVGMWSAHQRHGGEGAMYVYLKRRRP